MMSAGIAPPLILGACVGCLALSVSVTPPPATQTAALAANPYLTEARLDLAFDAEAAGRFPDAERMLLEAYRYDRMFLTRWTLANFYFRRGNHPEFWKWTRQTADIGNGDLAPLFDLCWRVDPTGQTVAEAAVPARAEAERSYLRYTVTTHRALAAAPVFTRRVAARDPADRPLLLRVVDALLAEQSTSQAVTAWNTMAQAGIIARGQLDPDRGLSLVNPRLESPLLGAAFDWHIVWNPEALVTGNRIEFTGTVDQWELLWQPVAFVPGRTYTLRCRYNTEGARHPSGLHWRVGQDSSPGFTGDGTVEWKFRAPSANLARLSLAYARPAGSPRIEGTVRVQSVHLEMQPTQ